MVSYLVLGLGKSGQSTYRYLKNKGHTVYCYDDKEPSDFKTLNIDAIVVSPGIPPKHPVLQWHKNIPVLIDIDIWFQDNPNALVLGITGSNGKSTVTAWLAHSLKRLGVDAIACGNIGLAILDTPTAQCYVLELSSYQLEYYHGIPFQGVIWTNLSANHLERHQTMENYQAAKERIFLNCKGPKVIAIDDEYSEKVCQKYNCIAVKSNNWQDQNYNLVFTLLKNLGYDDPALAMSDFQGLANRQEFVCNKNNITFINDSKATTALSVACALNSYENIIWLAGGVRKTPGLKFLDVFENVKYCLCFGADRELFQKDLKIATICYQSLDEAFNAALEKAKEFEKCTILLSPGGTSFDAFSDFEARGEYFKKLCLSYAHGCS